MTMIKCAECGKDISDKASLCIGCGAPINHAVCSVGMPEIERVGNQSNSIQNLAEDAKREETSSSNIWGKLARQIGDLNGDGKIDEKDLKIAAKKTKQLASSVAGEAAKFGKEVLKSELVKDAAAGAAVGAVVAIPVPIVGPATGAIVGAGLGVYKNLTK